MTNFQKILTDIVNQEPNGQKGVAEKLGIEPAYVSMLKGGKRKLSDDLAKVFAQQYGYDADELIRIQSMERLGLGSDDFLSHLQEPEPKINPTLKEVQLKLKKVKENKQKSILPNAQPNIETEKFKVVKLIPEKVAMGLISNFFDSEYVEQLETELIEVDEYFTEDAYKVDSVGESMNDGTARSLLDGDKFLAKDIPRAKWGDKLINGGKNLFYILHSERGHMIKEIIAHDIADKKLTLHSWNKDKKLYPDFEIHTNHCYIIASIQELLSRKMK